MPTGSSCAVGVSTPVRPTVISTSRITVVARSAGNLCATAQRGVRETKPSRSRTPRGPRHKPQPLLPVDAVDFVDATVNVVIELGAALLDLAMEGDQFV